MFEIIMKAGIRLAMTCISIRNETTEFLRCRGPFGKRYEDLLKLKGRYHGERCFIVCTGSNLATNNLEKLKNEYTFGMNSICLLADKTSFRPTFYGCSGLGVYQKLKTDIENYCSDITEVFVSNRIKHNVQIRKWWCVFLESVAYHTYDRWFTQNLWCKFGGNCCRIVYGVHNITHSLIQITAYMDLTKIYLLGADCSFPKGGEIHFKDCGVPDTIINTVRDRNTAGYEEVKEQTDKHGFKALNATHGGALEVFERVDLDKAIRQEENLWSCCL